jgi:hypothetical protein
VLTPDGRVAAGAQVAVFSPRPRRPGDPNPWAQMQKHLLASGTADEKGNFRLAFTRNPVRNRSQPALLISAPGFALTTRALNEFVRAQDIPPARLEPAQSVRGRLLGPDGQPARQVLVQVTGLDRPVQKAPNRDGPLAQTFRFPSPPGPLPAWPAPVRTDDAGRFVLEGLGPDLTVDVEVHDERYATQRFFLRTGPKERAGEVTLTLDPVRVLEGRVTAADTRLPLANARVNVRGKKLDAGLLYGNVEGRTDADGRFRLRPFPGQEFDVWVWPPTGSPYLVSHQTFRWPGQAARHELPLPLRRGVLVRGRVTEEGSGLPVAGAAVRFMPLWAAGGRPGVDPANREAAGYPWDAPSGPDGSFALPVWPGRGHLFIQGPTADYLHIETTSLQLEMERPGGQHLFPDALVPLDLRPGSNPPPVSASLRRGVTLRGRVVDHNGKPVAAGVLVSPTNISANGEMNGDPLPVRDGRFELPGCEPRKSVYVWVFSAAVRQGAYVKLRSNPNDEPVIRLAPCSTASVRLVDRTGRPLARPRGMLDLVLRAGPGEDEPGGQVPGARVTVPAWALYGRGFVEFEGKGDGVLRLPYLIPGAPYALRPEQQLGWPIKLVFTAVPGPLHLGDVEVNPRQQRRP